MDCFRSLNSRPLAIPRLPAPKVRRPSFRASLRERFNMCGIAGAIGKFQRGEAEAIVQSMVSTLDHRGPDDRDAQCWAFGSNTVVFGHTRLSIIDLSAA